MLRGRWREKFLFFSIFFLVMSLLFSLPSFAGETGNMGTEELEKRIQTLERELRELKQQTSFQKASQGRVWSKYDMQLYGRVKFDVHYDTVAFDAYNDFIGVISAKPDYTVDSINFNPRDTRFGFKVRHSSGNWVGLGHFEMDFYGDILGNNILPRVRLAYIDLKNQETNTSLRVGQDWVPIAQQNPHMCEFGILTASGNLWWRIPQLTLRQKAGNFEFLFSLMRHRRVSPEDNRWSWPWILGRVAYNLPFLDKGSLIAIGGGYMTEKAKTSGSSVPDIRLHKWLAVFEYKLRKNPIEIRGEAWVGQGIGGHWLRYDMDYNPFTGDEIRSQGGFISILWKTPLKKLALASGFGIDHNTSSDLKNFDWGASGNYDFYKRRYKRNMQAFCNIQYKVTKGIKFILEYIYVNTMRDTVREGSRITFSTFYSF